MSNSEDSMVTYTTVSSLFADLPDIRSSGVDGPPVMPEDPYAYVVAAFSAPPSPDYVTGPKYLPSPEFIPEPVYLEFMPLEDEILLAEEQPLPAAVSPTVNFTGTPYPHPTLLYVPDDEDVDIEGDEEEEEHPAPADSTAVALPAVDHASSAEETKPFETNEDETPISLPPREEVRALLLPPQKRLGISLGPRYEFRESSSAAARPTGGLRADYGFVATMDREIMRDLERDVGYGITDTWDEMLVDMPRAPATDDIEMGRRMTEFTTRVRQDTDEIYTRLDDEQSERQPMAGQLNMLYRDRRAHAHTASLIEAEARMSQEDWG
ncbi:hypothetical protein Tco_0533775 [Tanacetum coccineum]